MKIDSFLIGIGLFSLIAVIFLAATVQMTEKYADVGVSISIDDNASSVFNKASEINNQSEAMYQLITKTPTGPVDAVTSFLKGAWATIVSITSSLGMAVSLVTSSTSLLGLPPEITVFLVSAITITLVITIAYLAFSIGGKNT